MDVQVGDVIQTKKPHPCGANRFDVLRVGMDFKIKRQDRAQHQKSSAHGRTVAGFAQRIGNFFGRVWNPPLRVGGDACIDPGTWRQP